MTSSEAEFEESAVVQKIETYDVEVREKHAKKSDFECQVASPTPVEDSIL